MAGLIQKNLPGQMPEAQEDPREEATETPAQEQQEGHGEGDFTPEQNQALDDFVFAAKGLLYDKRTNAAAHVVQLVNGATDKVRAVADAAYDITASVDEKTGGSLEDELLAAAAAEVLQLVAEIAHRSGIPFESKELAAATRMMITRFVQENGGDSSQLPQSSDDDVSGQIQQHLAGA